MAGLIIKKDGDRFSFVRPDEEVKKPARLKDAPGSSPANENYVRPKLQGKLKTEEKKNTFNESKVRLSAAEQARIDKRNKALVEKPAGAFVYSIMEGAAEPMKAVGKLMGYKDTQEEKDFAEIAAKQRLTPQMDASKGMGTPRMVNGHDLGISGVGKLVGSLVPFGAAEQVAGRALGKLAPKLTGTALNATRGALAGSAVQGLNSAGQGKTGKEVAADVAIGAALGVGADIGLGYLGKIFAKARATGRPVSEVLNANPEIKQAFANDYALPEGVASLDDLMRHFDSYQSSGELQKVEDYYNSLQKMQEQASIKAKTKAPSIQEELGLPKDMSAQDYQAKLKKDLLTEEVDRYYQHLNDGNSPVDFKPFQVDNGSINPSGGLPNGKPDLSEAQGLGTGYERRQNLIRRVRSVSKPQGTEQATHGGMVPESVGRRASEDFRLRTATYSVKDMPDVDPHEVDFDAFIDGDTVYLNGDSNVNPDFRIGHEVLHNDLRKNVAVKQRMTPFVDALSDGGLSDDLDRYIRDNYDESIQQELFSDRRRAAEELISDVIGKAYARKYDAGFETPYVDLDDTIESMMVSSFEDAGRYDFKYVAAGTSPGAFSNAPNIEDELFPAVPKVDPNTTYAKPLIVQAREARLAREAAAEAGRPSLVRAMAEKAEAEGSNLSNRPAGILRDRSAVADLRYQRLYDSDGSLASADGIKERPKLQGKPQPAKTMEEVITRAPGYKDVGKRGRWTTDVYRVFKGVFGEDYDVVKHTVLDPFDSAKKAKVQDEKALTDALKRDIVDGLGIKKGSKESAMVMRYGENRLTEEDIPLLKEIGEGKIMAADKWFRFQYDKLIDEINVNRTAVGKDPIPKRQDYYRHYIEMSDTFQGIFNMFDTTAQISPQLVGKSEYTRPGEKWAGFKQRRITGNEFTEDAVGGFLDYVKAGTYAKHIDPEIQKFRDLETQLRNSTDATKSLNNFIGFLNEFTDDLAGKTNGWLDRWMMEYEVGRNGMRIMNALNGRMKANAVLGNLGSAVAQFANLPLGMAYVKDPRLMAKGLNGFFQSVAGGGHTPLYKESGFLQERLQDVYSQFDTKWFEQPQKMASWLLKVTDEVGTKSIWSSVYEKGLVQGVADPIKYADDVTRSLVAGRGIGEVPLKQKSKVFQLIAPFTLEVNNLWLVQKDFLSKKDFAGVAMLYAANFALNNVIEEIRGSKVTFDPIRAVIDGYTRSGDGLGDKLIGVTGSVTGEMLSNIPMGQYVAAAYPEYGVKIYDGGDDEEKAVKLPSRQELFGKNDPTRFGVGIPLARAAQDPVRNLLLPFGGAQLTKSMKAAETLGVAPRLSKLSLDKQSMPGSYTKAGDGLKTPVTPTAVSTLQGLTFGEGSIPEVREYYKRDGSPLGPAQTANFEKLVASGIKADVLYDVIVDIKKQGLDKKADVVKALGKTGLPQIIQARILSGYFYPPEKKK